MSSFTDKIKNIFDIQGGFIKNSETFDSYIIQFCIKSSPKLSKHQIEEVLDLIKDSFVLVVGSFTLSNRSSDEETEYFFDNIIDNSENEVGREIIIKIDIKKNSTNNILNIYNYKIFTSFIKERRIKIILEWLSKFTDGIGINILYDNVPPIKTNFIHLQNNLTNTALVKNKRAPIKEYCHFGNIDSFPFDPDCFHLENYNNEDKFHKFLKKLASIYLIVSLFDITTIKDKELYYKLLGQRHCSGTISFNELNFSNYYDVYYKIYKWVYNKDSSNIADRIGLARNVISIHLHDNSLKIDDSTMEALLSNYNLYLKNNLSTYLNLRNNILTELNIILQRTNEVSKQFIENFKKNMNSILYFFITVFVIRFISKPDGKVITSEAMILSLGFIMISFFYLCYSNRVFRCDKKYLEEKYKNIEVRYSDLFLKEDIKKILNNDHEFKNELEHLKKVHSRYQFLWISINILLIITVVVAYIF